MFSFFLHVLAFVAPTFAAPPGWESLGVTDGVEVARKSMPDSSLFAFRGEADVDVPLGYSQRFSGGMDWAWSGWI